MSMVIRHLDTAILMGLVAALGIILWFMFGKTETTESSARPASGSTNELKISVEETYPIAKFDRPPIRDEIKTTCTSDGESSMFDFRPDFHALDPEHFVVIGAKGFINPDNALYARFEFSVETPEPSSVFLPLVRIMSLDSKGKIVTDRVFAPWEYHHERWQATCRMGAGNIVEGRTFLGDLDETEQVDALAIEFCSYIARPGRAQCGSALASQ